jgi:long-chain acyl-CoA synthetase
MNFIENILHRLSQSPDRAVLQEVRDGQVVTATCDELLAMIRTARAFLRRSGVRKRDRCALLAHNSIRWAALDLALMAEGITVVPLYARQAPAELVGMMKDSGPSLVLCGDAALRDRISQSWADGPPLKLFDEVFDPDPHATETSDAAAALADGDTVTIIYTSGTSGEPKGVMLNVANLSYMVPCTNARLDLLMGEREEADRVFHYLPLCFAGSWIMMLTALSRHSVLVMSTDLNKLAEEMKAAAPHYFLNVPALLERVRSGVEDQINKKGGIAKTLYERGKAAWFRQQNHKAAGLDQMWAALANWVVFPTIKSKLGPDLKALICGSAPLAKETQLFFAMIGIPVLQVYGLTETTAICTMDHPHQVAAGRVGPAIGGIEMKLGEGDEILVRGPNIFPGYWNRAEATAGTISNGWFHTGDQGEVNSSGNWAIIGRIKNLIILSSGHNIAPEPVEEMVQKSLTGACQVMIIGNGRSYLSAVITGEVTALQVEAALEAVNARLPHYKQVRAFHISKEPFSIENGLLTANGKLKRDTITAHYRDSIEDLYRVKKA